MLVKDHQVGCVCRHVASDVLSCHSRCARVEDSELEVIVKPHTKHVTPHPWLVAGQMALRAWTLLPLAAGTLFLGMAIYHWVEGLPWPDAFLNAAMLLGGMGPVDRLNTTAGKWLAAGMRSSRAWSSLSWRA